MEKYLGSFQAQYFKWISFDPNTIFNFFVFDDRLALVKVGTALNQLPQIFSRGLVKGPVLLRNLESENVPALSAIQDLVHSSGTPSREILFSEIESARQLSRGIFARGLHLSVRPNERLFFRFLKASHFSAALEILQAALGESLVRD